MKAFGNGFTLRRTSAGVLLLSFCSALSSAAQSTTRGAQPQDTQPTVAQCTTISAVITDQQSTAIPQSRNGVTKPLVQLVNECLDRIDIRTASSATLLEIAYARSTFGDQEKANAVSRRLLSTIGSTDSLRADSLSKLAMTYVIGNSNRMAFADKLASMVDSLPNARPLQKVALHQRLFQRYRAYDNDIGVRNHALAIVALARGLEVHVRTKEAPAVPAGMVEASMLLEVYRSAATMLGNFGEEKQALALLQEARTDHPEVDIKYFNSAFHFTEQRLRLVGEPARPIPSGHWFNAPEGTKALDYDGKVTLIGFTAHWCPPCLHTYVPFQALADTLGKDGLQVMFATEYFGFVGDPNKKLIEADETVATRAYYDNKGIRFPIALLGPGLDSTLKERTTTDSAFLFYGIEVVPLAAIVDRKGIVRRVVAGWDSANPARLNELLRRLLNEN